MSWKEVAVLCWVFLCLFVEYPSVSPEHSSRFVFFSDLPLDSPLLMFWILECGRLTGRRPLTWAWSSRV